MLENEIRFLFDGKRLTAKKGDTIASALWRNGIKVITRSIKFHRPRGLHCGTGDCPNCFANVNGVPNVRTCITPVEDGMVVVPQNKVLLRNFDPIGIMDLIYRDGFNYHHKFIRPSFASGFYQRIVRRMTGIGRLPSADLNAKPARKLRPDLLIIGNEPVAMRLAEICSRERIKIVVAGRKNYEDRISNKLSAPENVRILSHSFLVGAYDDRSVGVVAGDGLLIFKPKTICIAEEGREAPLRFVNWDLPGIIQCEAAKQLLEAGIRLGDDIVLYGDTRRAIELAKKIADTGSHVRAVLCESCDESVRDTDIHIKSNCRVKRAIGRKELKRIEISSGTSVERIPCDCLVTLGSIHPDIELARQLGCEIATDRKQVPYVSVNENFETSVKGVFAIGSSTNEMDATKALEYAPVVANAIAQRIRGMGT